MCKEEYFDPYADKTNVLPFCKNDSLLCSKIEDHVQSGQQFCNLIGFAVSELQDPTMRLDYDCFNGVSSVNVKYDRLEIDEKVKAAKEDEEMVENILGGADSATGFLGSMLSPMLLSLRKLYRESIGGIVNYVMFILVIVIGYELFANRRVHKPLTDYCCKKGKPSRGRAPEAARDIARQERIRHIQERLSKKTQD